MTTTGAPADMQVRRIHTASGSHIEPPLNETWSDFDKLRWHAAVTKEDTGLTIIVTPWGRGRFDLCLNGRPFCHIVGETFRLSYREAWHWINTVSYAAEIGRYELKRFLAASDSPPGAVGLGLVPPEGPNPTEMEGAE